MYFLERILQNFCIQKAHHFQRRQDNRLPCSEKKTANCCNSYLFYANLCFPLLLHCQWSKNKVAMSSYMYASGRMRPKDLKVQLMTLQLKNFNNIGLTMKVLVILQERLPNLRALVVWTRAFIMGKCRNKMCLNIVSRINVSKRYNNEQTFRIIIALCCT